MDRQEWEFSTHSLRELLYGFNGEGDMDRVAKYKFGSVWNPMFGFFHIYHQGVGTIGTIKLGDKTILRHSEHSLFRYELQKFQYKDKPTLLVPSVNLHRHDNWVTNRISDRIRREVRNRQTFLEEQQMRAALQSSTEEQRTNSATTMGQFGLRIPVLGQAISSWMARRNGQPSTSAVQHSTIDVMFMSPPSTSEQAEAHAIVGELMHTEYEITAGQWTLGQLRERLRDCNMAREQDAIMQRSMYAVTSSDVQRNTFMGRPFEQIREYLRTIIPEGVSISEEHMMHAVRAMDMENVPRDMNYSEFLARQEREEALQTYVEQSLHPMYSQEYTEQRWTRRERDDV